MKREIYERIALTLKQWGCPVLTGWKALARCAVVAAQHEEWGEKWNATGVCQEVAVLWGKTQATVWADMAYTLRSSNARLTPAAAIAQLVKVVRE